MLYCLHLRNVFIHEYIFDHISCCTLIGHNGSIGSSDPLSSDPLPFLLCKINIHDSQTRRYIWDEIDTPAAVGCHMSDVQDDLKYTHYTVCARMCVRAQAVYPENTPKERHTNTEPLRESGTYVLYYDNI
jgi:hypothetical protein